MYNLLNTTPSLINILDLTACLVYFPHVKNMTSLSKPLQNNFFHHTAYQSWSIPLTHNHTLIHICALSDLKYVFINLN